MTQTVTFRQTVEQLKAAGLHEMTLYVSDKDGSVYFLPQPLHSSDRPLGMLPEFLAAAGKDSLEGLDDDAELTAAFEVAGDAPAEPAPAD